MANLRLPDACAECAAPLAVGDRIVFERRAMVVDGRPDVYRYGRRPHALEPRVEAHSPRNVRHVDCERPQG